MSAGVWVKHFQAIHHSGVDVARGLALLFGLGTKALPSAGLHSITPDPTERPSFSFFELV